MLDSLKLEATKGYLKEDGPPKLDNELNTFLDSPDDPFSDEGREAGAILSQNKRSTKGKTNSTVVYAIDYEDIRDKLEKVIKNKTFTLPQVEIIVRLMRHEFGIGDKSDLEFLKSKSK